MFLAFSADVFDTPKMFCRLLPQRSSFCAFFIKNAIIELYASLFTKTPENRPRNSTKTGWILLFLFAKICSFVPYFREKHLFFCSSNMQRTCSFVPSWKYRPKNILPNPLTIFLWLYFYNKYFTIYLNNSNTQMQ